MEFSMPRFINLLRRDYILHGKKILYAFLLVILVLTILTLIGHRLISPNAGGGIQVIMICFFGFLIFGGGFLTSSNLGDLNSAAKRTQYLSIPASTFEKVLSKWFYTLVLFLSISYLIFYGFAAGYTSMFADKIPPEAQGFMDHITARMFPFFSMLYIIGHSIAFFFSFVFNSFVAVKGGLVTIVIFLVLSLIVALFNLGGEHSFDRIWGDAIFNIMVLLQENLKRFLLIAPVFWVLAYYVFARKTA